MVATSNKVRVKSCRIQGHSLRLQTLSLTNFPDTTIQTGHC